MTHAEATVCFEYHLQVTIQPKTAEKYGLNDNSKYFITELIKAYHPIDKKFQMRAVISANGRALYEFELSCLQYLEEQQLFVQSKIKQKNIEFFRAMLKKMLEEHKTKKAINKIVNEEIDSIKSKLKGA